MRAEFTKEQEQFLINAYKDLAGNHELNIDMDFVDDKVRDYINNNGLPETDEHDMLFGDDLDTYLENHGVDFEDYKTILEA